MGCTFDLSTPGRGRQSSLNLNQAWSAQGVPSQSVQHSETASKDKEERKEGREGRRKTEADQTHIYLVLIIDHFNTNNNKNQQKTYFLKSFNTVSKKKKKGKEEARYQRM